MLQIKLLRQTLKSSKQLYSLLSTDLFSFSSLFVCWPISYCLFSNLVLSLAWLDFLHQPTDLIQPCDRNAFIFFFRIHHFCIFQSFFFSFCLFVFLYLCYYQLSRVVTDRICGQRHVQNS